MSGFVMLNIASRTIMKIAVCVCAVSALVNQLPPHGHRAQVDKIKAVAPLALLDDHTPATKPGERPWPVGLVATHSLVPARRISRWPALCSGV